MSNLPTTSETPTRPSTRAIRRVNELLIGQYGQRKPMPREPIEGLVLIILSQATSDVNCDRAFRSLREKFPQWEDVVTAPTEAVADAIRSGGLANQKAARIKAILAAIREQEGGFDLGWMRDASADDCRAYLEKFHGIGPKTIACVLLFFLDKPAFPVDTHVHRVTRRLGWVRPKASAEEAHWVLEKAVPDDCKLDLHINLISHGRAICRAEGDGGPQCGKCVIKGLCVYGKGVRVKRGQNSGAAADKFHGTDFFVTMHDANSSS